MNKRLKKFNIIEKWHSSITFKIFLTTSLLLITLSLFIYFSLYFLLPSFYRDYKINNVERGVDTLVESIEYQGIFESFPALDEFSHDNNVRLFLLTPDGESLFQDFPLNLIATVLDERTINLRGIPWELTVESERYSGARLVSFAEGDFILAYFATLQPVDEVANMLFLFIPYIVAVILCFTTVSVAFYSKTITKPLLQINRVAKRMARLDFDETSVVASDDEIGQLSQSLNQMSDNLERAMMDLKNANEQLMDDIQRERELEKKRSEFIATISHELKTPITTVKGQIEAMIYNIGPYKDRDKYLRRSYEVMGEMESLVREVLTVSKLEHFEPKMEQTSLTDIVMACSENLDYFYKKKDLQLQMNLEEVTTWLDSNLMKKAIGNVINNAVKYAPQGAKIQVDLNVQNQCPFLRVYNSGTSIDEAEIEKIFGAFYRLEKSRNRNTGGSGLGLYIVHQVLDIHNVKYEIKNVNDGVEFTMIFPEIEKG